MELNNLPGYIITLVLVGLVMGVGLYVLTAVGDSQRVSTTVTDEAVTFAGLQAQLANDRVTAVIAFANVTGEVNATTVTDVTPWLNFTTGGLLTGDGRNFTNTSHLISYRYDAAGTVTENTDDFVTGVGAFATWLPVIIVVIAAGIIIAIVVKDMVR